MYLGDTRKCVDAGSSQVGAQLMLWDCNGHDSQKWGYDPNMKTVYLSTSSDANLCLDLRGGSKSKGTPAQVWGCNGHSNQQWAAVPGSGQTSVTKKLNADIAPGKNGVYTGGKGILVRNLFDGYEEKTNWKVVPSTFWTNDIVTPSAVYPTGWNGFGGNGNANCPNNQWNGYYHLQNKCNTDKRTNDSGPWNYATTAYVISDAMPKFFPHFDKIQDATWGYGVFYPTDSNSVDGRCRWLGSENEYDCPGGVIPWGGQFTAQSDKYGAGSYHMGNPFASSNGGGGAGCHFDGANVIDQTKTDNGLNLVRNRDCECEYKFKDNWGHWVDQWVQHGSNVKSEDGWGHGKKAPSHGLDQASCWMNNPRDMINLQNMIYWKGSVWSNQLAPQSHWDSNVPTSLRVYWGWNEVPIDIDLARDTKNRDAVMIKLPAALCPGSNGGLDTIACLSYGAQENLEGDLDIYVGHQLLLPGLGNAGNRPGSYVVFAREYISTGMNWQRWFYCENWVSPSGKYQVRFVPETTSNLGACFLDWGPKEMYLV